MWGESEIGLKPTYLAYLRLKYCLEDLKKVQGVILDAGCGGGGFAKAVKHYRSGLKVVGVDSNREAIKKVSKNPQGVEFRVGSLYKLPFEKESFDVVVVADVLEHLESPEKAIQEINRVLKKGGLFHAFIPLEGELYALHFWFERIGWRFKEDMVGHIQKFKFSQLKKLLADSRFKIEKTRFSVHLLGQIVDVSYFSFFSLLKKDFEAGLESRLRDKPLLRFLKEAITIVINLESQLLSFLPAAGVHLLCRKRN